MDAGNEQQLRKGSSVKGSAMLLSLLFSVWLAIGAIFGELGPSATSIERVGPSKAVMVKADGGKQAQQPRQLVPTPLLPSATRVSAKWLSYPANLFVARPVTLIVAGSTSPYLARAPPAR